MDFEDRASADLFVSLKTDQSHTGHTITRQRGGNGAGNEKAPVGAFEAILELLNENPNLPRNAPIVMRNTTAGWKVVTRPEAVAALKNDGSLYWWGPDPTRVALGKDRGSNPVGSARDVGVVDSTSGALEITRIYGKRKGSRRRRKSRVGCPYKKII